MLKRIELTHFRQHRHLSLDFTQGINVIRGANEAGKTTLMEAITYALFGNKATRNNDLTHHDCPKDSHQVILHFCIGNQDYRIQRSPRGAELTSDNLRITGQTDTAKYCEQLMQLPAQTSHKLMFVSQNQIRGVLAEGNAKATQFIEQMAQMDLVDTLIDTLQTQHPTGKTDMLEHSLNQFIAQQAEWTSIIAQTTPPEQARDTALQHAQHMLNDLAEQAKTRQQAYERAQQAFQNAQTADNQRKQLSQMLTRVQQQYSQIQGKLAQQETPFDPQQLALADIRHEQLRAQFQAWQDYQRVKQCRITACVPMSKAQLQKELEYMADEINQIDTHLSQKRFRLKQVQDALKDSSATCPTCQRLWDDHEQRQAQRQALKDEEHNLQHDITHLQNKKKGLNQQYREHLDILHTRLPEFPKDVPTQWLVNESTYPPTYIWTGDTPQETTAQQVQQALHRYQQLRQEAAKQEALMQRKQDYLDQLAQLQDEMRTLQQQLNALPSETHPLAQLQAQAQQAQQQWQETQIQQRQWQDKQQSIHAQYTQDVQRWQELHHRQKQAQEQVAHHQQQLHHAQQANALLKALRQAKPKLAQHIWQTLCQTASHYFSQMRQQESQITHQNNGFLVNGHDSNSLSGSTQDLLGLALRIALIKTFAPSTQTLLLDEPFASSDVRRTAQAMSVLSTLGFEQILLITHEDVSETLATQILTL